MAMVEFTSRAEKSLLDLLGKTKRLDDTLLLVEMKESEAQLSVKSFDELTLLQRDVDLVGPFRVPIGGEEICLFVRDADSSASGLYELDFYSCGGRNCFQIRPLQRG